MTISQGPLRILHVIAPADFGGLERVVHGLAVGQRRRGHHVNVLAVLDHGREADHPVVAELVADGVPVDVAALPPRAYREERRQMRRALERHGPHVVHTHGARVDVLDAPVARRAGFGTVTTVHGFTGGGPKNRLYEYLQRRSMRRADAVVIVSPAQLEVLAGAGIPRARIHTVPNAWAGGRTAIERNDARRRLGIEPTTRPVLGWVGRLTPEKGPDVFLRAAALLRDVDPLAVFVGAGRRRAALEALAGQLGVSDQVRWTGRIDGAGALLGAFDLFVMSSRTEGTPIILFEAIDAGVPVVATAVGGIPNVIGPDEGILAKPEDPAALADAVRMALRDPAASRRRATAARARVARHFGLESWLDRYDDIYRSVARKRG